MVEGESSGQIEPSGQIKPSGQIRASDADRAQVEQIIGEALADGRLTTEEHHDRLDRLYAGKTYADLAPLTADLGQADTALVQRRPTSPVPVERVRPQIALLSTTTARPLGRVEGGVTATAVLGNVDVDLSHATLGDTGVVVKAQAVLGSVNITVPADARVNMTGIPLLGSLSPTREPGPADGPLVVVKGFAGMGSITIHRADDPS